MRLLHSRADPPILINLKTAKRKSAPLTAFPTFLFGPPLAIPSLAIDLQSMAEIAGEDFAESLIFPYISLTYPLHFP
jgi:hypothetical protein